MKDVAHPSDFIKKDLIDQIRSSSGTAESLRTLHPDQLSIINKENWFNMFVPKDYGGLGLSLVEGVKIEESVCYADGSTGWVVTLCSGAAWFVGFLNPDLSREVFAESNVCFAGSGAPTGIAEQVEGGYNVSGYWKYASGSLHASVFTANCILTKGGQPIVNQKREPVIRSFLFKKEEVKINLTWKSIGMMATGSHDFEIRNITVPGNRTFLIEADRAVITDPLYQYPFLQLAEVTLTANLSGMAARFLDLSGILFQTRLEKNQYTEIQHAVRFEKLREAEIYFQEQRNAFYEALENSWKSCESGAGIPTEQLDQVSRCSHQLATTSRNLVDELYPYCGLVATNMEEEINRVWRNFHTATQHSMFTS